MPLSFEERRNSVCLCRWESVLLPLLPWTGSGNSVWRSGEIEVFKRLFSYSRFLIKLRPDSVTFSRARLELHTAADMTMASVSRPRAQVLGDMDQTQPTLARSLPIRIPIGNRRCGRMGSPGATEKSDEEYYLGKSLRMWSRLTAAGLKVCLR